MNSRLKGLGIVLVLVGLAFIAGGGYAYIKTQEGAKALHAFSAAQNVTLGATRTASSSIAARPKVRRRSCPC
jgi:hypothetical protein